jgi:hypothetical protein
LPRARTFKLAAEVRRRIILLQESPSAQRSLDPLPLARSALRTDARASHQRFGLALPIGVAVGGSVMLVVGAALLGSAHSGFDDLQRQCAPQCDPASWSTLPPREHAGQALLAVGALAIAADIVLWIVRPKREQRTTVAMGIRF